MENKNSKDAERPGLLVILCHWCFILFAAGAFLTGESAADFDSDMPFGFYIHGALGMGLAFALFIYIALFFFGNSKDRYRQWLVFNRNRFAQIFNDLKAIFTFHLPPPEKHGGLAELVQIFGILCFLLVSVTGLSIILVRFFDAADSQLLNPLLALHDTALSTAFLYLAIHIMAVTMHTFAGHKVLGKILFPAKKNRQV